VSECEWLFIRIFKAQQQILKKIFYGEYINNDILNSEIEHFRYLEKYIIILRQIKRKFKAL